MEKTVVYEYSHRGLGRPVRKDQRSENESGNSNANKSAKIIQSNTKEKVKNDRHKLPNPLAHQNIKNAYERKNKEVSRPVAKNDGNKSSVSEKHSLPKTDFAIPPPRAPLPPSFEMEIDDDCLSTITVAAPAQSNSALLTKASTKERTNLTKNDISSSGTYVDASSKSDCKKEGNGSSNEEAKTASSTNGTEKKALSADSSIVLIKLTEILQKDETWKKKVTETFKSFLEQKNKIATKSSEAEGKVAKGTSVEENKETDRHKTVSIKKEKKIDGEPSPSNVNRKEKSRNTENGSSSSRKPGIKVEKGAHDNKKGVSKDDKHEGSKSRSHRHQNQDGSSKDKSSEDVKKISSSKSARDSNGHRLRHNSGKSHSSRSSSSKEKKSSEPESRKRKAGSPDHSKSIKKEKVESREKSHERSKKSSESRSRKSKRDLKEITRMQKSLFEPDNVDENEGTELRMIKTEKNKYHKKPSARSKDSKSGKASHMKKSPGEVDPLEIVVLSSDSSDVSPERPHRPSKGKDKVGERRSSRKMESNGRPKTSTMTSEKESKRECQSRESNPKIAVKRAGSVLDGHNLAVSETTAKETLAETKATEATFSSPPNTDKNSKKEIKNKTLGLQSVSQSPGHQETETKHPSTTADKSSVKATNESMPVTKSEIVLTSVPIVSLVDICKSDNKESRELCTAEDFPAGTDISDGEVDLENLEATLNISSFPQDFACSSSDELAAIMNMDYDEDDKEIGKYAKHPSDSSNIPDGGAPYMANVNNYASGSGQGVCAQGNTNQLLGNIEIQQDFPVLSIPDPTAAPAVDNSEDSEEEVPLIRIRTDLFTDSLEPSSSCGISPTRAAEKQTVVPPPPPTPVPVPVPVQVPVPVASDDNHAQQKSMVVEEVKRTIAEVLTIGTSVQQKFNAALEALRCHSEALSVNNFDSDIQNKSEQSLSCFNSILQLGSQQLSDKVKRCSTILAVHNDNFAITEMQMDRAANYFAIVVLINVMIADSLYNEFVTELMGVRYRILCILKVYFSQLILAPHGETWYFHVNSIIQGKLISSQYEAWNLVANKSWAILKSFEEAPAKTTSIYEHRVIGCEGFKEIVENILISVRRKLRQSSHAVGNSEVDCIQDILNAIFVSSNGPVPANPAPSNVAAHESPMITNTASSYLNNCSLVYSPVSVSPISPPNCNNYGGPTSVTTASAPMVFRETMANNMSLSSYTPSTMSGVMTMQHQSPSNVRPASVHYREQPNQNFTVTNSYDGCAMSSFASDSICLPMAGGNGGNVSIMSHSSQQAQSVQPGNNYYNPHSSQLYGMNSNEYNMYSQPQQVNRTSTPQVQMRSYSVVNHQNMSYANNQVSLTRPSQHTVRMQQRQASHILPQSGNQYQGQTQNTAYLSTTCDRYQPSYNAIHALSTITGNQGMVQSSGNDSLSVQPQNCQLNCHAINSPQSTLPTMISTDNHSHYQNDPDSACQATKSQMTHQQNLPVQGTPQGHHVMARSISMPIENSGQLSTHMLDRRSSFESFAAASGTANQQNNVNMTGSRISNGGDSGLFLKVLRE